MKLVPLLFLAATANAANISFSLFNGNGDASTLTASTMSDGNDTILTIESTQATITGIFFEGIESATIIDNDQINFVQDDGATLPGWSMINWDRQNDIAFTATPPPTVNGVGRRERINFRVYLNQSEFLRQLNANEVRIAMHVQQFDNSSGSFNVTPVPEPSTVTFSAFASAMLIFNRRRK